MLSKDFLHFIKLAVLVLVLLFAFMLHYKLPKEHSRVYDCSISEISPDYPIEVKEGCRKLRSEKIK